MRLTEKMMVIVLGRHSLLSENSSQPVVHAYSPPITFHIVDIHIVYAIVLSTGLDGVQVDQINKENNSQTSTYEQLPYGTYISWV